MPFLDVGRRLEFHRHGAEDPEAPTLVLLHHGLGSVSSWRRFPEEAATATGLGALAYSRWGYGKSEPFRDFPHPVEFMHREALEDLPALLRRLDVRRPILVGHSDGASIALLYAAAGLSPPPLGLFLLAPHVFVEDRTVAAAVRARLDYETGDLRERLARHHADVDSAFYGWNTIWLLPQFRAWNIEAEVSRVRCPITVVQGEDDEYGTSAQAESIRARAPGAEIVLLPECGHEPQRDRPVETLRALQAHVGRLLDR